MRIKFEGIKNSETRAYLFAEVPLGVVIPDGKNDIIKRDRSGHLDKIRPIAHFAGWNPP